MGFIEWYALFTDCVCVVRKDTPTPLPMGGGIRLVVRTHLRALRFNPHRAGSRLAGGRCFHHIPRILWVKCDALCYALTRAGGLSTSGVYLLCMLDSPT